jgi:hypothetical protein
MFYEKRSYDTLFDFGGLGLVDVFEWKNGFRFIEYIPIQVVSELRTWSMLKFKNTFSDLSVFDAKKQNYLIDYLSKPKSMFCPLFFKSREYKVFKRVYAAGFQNL